MVRTALKRYATGIAPLAVLSVVLVVALTMMGAATQNSLVFGRAYSLLLVVNVVGIAMLLGLILAKLRRLMAQVRAGVMGSRLSLRLLGFFLILAVVPMSVVYFFSVEAFSRGIDNWFDVRIEHALDDALAMGRASLDTIMQELERRSHDMALRLSHVPNANAAPLLNSLRGQNPHLDITLFNSDGKLVASTSRAETAAEQPNGALLARVRSGMPFTAIDPHPKGGFQLRVLVPVYGRDTSSPARILQVIEQLPDRYSKLGESVQAAFAEYEKLIYLRGPLKFGMILTLSLVALLTLLIAVWGAMFFVKRLVTPLRDLVDGTRAVSRGNYSKRLPIPANDELGVLVQSFNDMTRKIHFAQSQIKRSQQETEVERTYLETVLTHLSSGVLSFDPRHRLRTHNPSAAHILGVDLQQCEGKTLRWILATQPQLAGFAQTIEHATADGRSEWHAEVTLQDERRRRTLILRGTMLPALGQRRGGHVVVFDDITALIQAQREAAWSEVARRLAHEIKNPLTPIQLSAERIRHKCLEQLPSGPRETLDRATRVIVQQVESMKTMVNAFSEYARPAHMQLEPVDINLLIHDVAELYGGRLNPVKINLDLAANLPPVFADAGRLRQVLHNLLLNSHDALVTVPAPVIEIRTQLTRIDDHSFMEIHVSDNGPGFEQAVRSRLFEPYVTTKEKGTGLGLAIVKKIVEEHGGALSVENSDAPTRGACLTVRLPMPSQASAKLPTERSA